MNIIRNKWIFIGLSVLLSIASIAAIATFGLEEGIDFRGGTLWQITATSTATTIAQSDLKNFFDTTLKINDTQVLPQSDGSFLVRTPEIDEATHQKTLTDLKKKYPSLEELRFETIGASIGSELRDSSVTVFIFVLLGISLYITFAFRKVSQPVSSWKYGVITLLTLFHDALIPIGALAVFGRYYGVEIDVTTVVAILVVMGFSVHDTIVVFDRIREHLRTQSSNSKESFDSLVNTSVRETFARSVNTSLTLVLVLVALLIFGAADLRYFILTILIGVTVGTYSSIFLASPLLTLWRKK